MIWSNGAAPGLNVTQVSLRHAAVDSGWRRRGSARRGADRRARQPAARVALRGRHSALRPRRRHTLRCSGAGRRQLRGRAVVPSHRSSRSEQRTGAGGRDRWWLRDPWMLVGAACGSRVEADGWQVNAPAQNRGVAPVRARRPPLLLEVPGCGSGRNGRGRDVSVTIRVLGVSVRRCDAGAARAGYGDGVTADEAGSRSRAPPCSDVVGR